MPANRQKTGRFAPGTSGNPSGRPKQTKEQADALEAIRALVPDAVGEVKRLLLAKDTPPAVKFRLAELILDRTYGKPKQYANITETPQGDIEIVITGEADE